MGRHYLFVEQYDYAKLCHFFERFAARSTGATWQEAALYLGRLGKWEFEDYSTEPPSQVR
jgi:hypothetical protein